MTVSLCLSVSLSLSLSLCLSLCLCLSAVAAVVVVAAGRTVEAVELESLSQFPPPPLPAWGKVSLSSCDLTAHHRCPQYGLTAVYTNGHLLHLPLCHLSSLIGPVLSYESILSHLVK